MLLRGGDALADPERTLAEVGDVGGEGRDMVEAVAGACTGAGTGTGSGAGMEDLAGAGAVKDEEANASNEGLAEPVSDLDEIPNASSNETPLLVVPLPVPLLVTLLVPNASSNENPPGTVGVEFVFVSLSLDVALAKSKLSSNEFWKLNPEDFVSS